MNSSQASRLRRERRKAYGSWAEDGDDEELGRDGSDGMDSLSPEERARRLAEEKRDEEERRKDAEEAARRRAMGEGASMIQGGLIGMETRAQFGAIDDAASSLQAGMLSKQERDRLAAERAWEEDEAARRIQGSMQSRQDRLDLDAMHGELGDAASTLQGHLRGAETRDGMDALHWEDANQAGERIQGGIRGRQGRRAYGDHLDDVNAAARTLQGGLRGQQGRYAVDDLHCDREMSAQLVQGALNATDIRRGVNSELEYQDGAAALIQAQVRAKNDRSELAARRREKAAWEAKLSEEERRALRRKRWPADVKEWRAAVDRHMMRFSREAGKKLLQSPVLPQGSPFPGDPAEVPPETIVDMCREAFVHLTQGSDAKVDVYGEKVIPPAHVATIVLSLCSFVGQSFALQDEEELLHFVCRDVQVSMERGGHGIMKDPLFWEDEEPRATFVGMMLSFTRHPWQSLLPRSVAKKIPSVLMSDMRLAHCGKNHYDDEGNLLDLPPANMDPEEYSTLRLTARSNRSELSASNSPRMDPGRDAPLSPR